MSGYDYATLVYAPKEAYAELTRLREREGTTHIALAYAIPALEWLLERNDIDIDDYETCDPDDDLCDLEDCNECGCITTKLTLARKALATLDVPAPKEQR